MAASSLSTKHIPTLLGLVILAGGLIGGILLVNTKNLGFLPRASPETTPKNLKITNLTDSSFSVSWVTDSKTPGYIKYGSSPSSLTTTITDDRDQISGGVGVFLTHHVTIRSLSPQTTYYFKIGTGTSELYDDSGSPYSAQTVSATSGEAKTLYGNVISTDGAAAGGALVYITSDAFAPLSTLTQSSGSFVLSLGTARTKDGRGAAVVTDTTKISLLIRSPFDTKTSLVDTFIGQAQPIADVTLGINSDATVPQSTPIPEIPGQESNPVLTSKFSTQLLSPPREASSSATLLTISSPISGQVLETKRPTFQGTGPKSTTLSLRLTGNSTLSSSTKTNNNGAWSYTPASNLKAGSYALTAKGTVNGIQSSASATFVIMLPTPAPAQASVQSSSDSSELVTGSSEVTFALFAAGILFLSAGITFASRKSPL